MSIKRETFIGKMIERYGTKYDPNKVIYKSYKENAEHWFMCGKIKKEEVI